MSLKNAALSSAPFLVKHYLLRLVLGANTLSPTEVGALLVVAHPDKSQNDSLYRCYFPSKRLLPVSARLQVFQSLVQSHLNFCSLVWGFASKNHIYILPQSIKDLFPNNIPSLITKKIVLIGCQFQLRLGQVFSTRDQC